MAPPDRWFRLLAAIVLSFWLLGPASALALVFGSPDSEPTENQPPNFPYWENLSQHRFGGPTVIYLGAGWILTARHVGLGQVEFGGDFYVPDFGSRHPLLNLNGTTSDAVVFRLNDKAGQPDLPILPLIRTPLKPGEEVLVIGFGRGRENVFEWRENGRRHFKFEWTANGSKRWGTNRIEAIGGVLPQQDWTTHVVSFSFDEPGAETTTRFEAQAAVGDSGGAVFVERNGEWQLAGMMVSISGSSGHAGSVTHYGDITYAADIMFYRSEIMRWTRPACFNEEDDDGDGEIDFPADRGCLTRLDTDEREVGAARYAIGLGWALAAVGASILCAGMFFRFRQRIPL